MSGGASTGTVEQSPTATRSDIALLPTPNWKWPTCQTSHHSTTGSGCPGAHLTCVNLQTTVPHAIVLCPYSVLVCIVYCV